mmetsp:Transcript_3197/g.7575  ORF Transcript_3197/g.7575 Transcript_3197/m.7575 type:complete len:493 (-) Transcript_3197:81-1559(-)
MRPLARARLHLFAERRALLLLARVPRVRLHEVLDLLPLLLALRLLPLALAVRHHPPLRLPLHQLRHQVLVHARFPVLLHRRQPFLHLQLLVHVDRRLVLDPRRCHPLHLPAKHDPQHLVGVAPCLVHRVLQPVAQQLRALRLVVLVVDHPVLVDVLQVVQRLHHLRVRLRQRRHPRPDAALPARRHDVLQRAWLAAVHGLEHQLARHLRHVLLDVRVHARADAHHKRRHEVRAQLLPLRQAQLLLGRDRVHRRRHTHPRLKLQVLHERALDGLHKRLEDRRLARVPALCPLHRLAQERGLQHLCEPNDLLLKVVFLVLCLVQVPLLQTQRLEDCLATLLHNLRVRHRLVVLPLLIWRPLRSVLASPGPDSTRMRSLREQRLCDVDLRNLIIRAVICRLLGSVKILHLSGVLPGERGCLLAIELAPQQLNLPFQTCVVCTLLQQRHRRRRGVIRLCNHHHRHHHHCGCRNAGNHSPNVDLSVLHLAACLQWKR